MQLKKSDFHFRDISELPEHERKEVQRWISYLSTIQKPIHKSLADIARRMDCSMGTVRRKYDLWRNYEDWRDLVNYARLPKSDNNRIKFIEWWQALCIVHGRNCTSAHQDFVRRFNSGEKIPGICRDIPRNRLPDGCGYDSLIRLAPKRFDPSSIAISTRKKPYRNGTSRRFWATIKQGGS